jgi:phenylpropionate dioxygenase-like ring-hydroxylating dioxygenase large terminal subunit
MPRLKRAIASGLASIVPRWASASTAPDEIKALVNSCLHRGTLLRISGGCVNQFRCPFRSFALPEARVGVWAEFVFINFDADAEPLETNRENLAEHFADCRLEGRWRAAHAAKIIPCNWSWPWRHSAGPVMVEPRILRSWAMLATIMLDMRCGLVPAMSAA